MKSSTVAWGTACWGYSCQILCFIKLNELLDGNDSKCASIVWCLNTYLLENPQISLLAVNCLNVAVSTWRGILLQCRYWKEKSPGQELSHQCHVFWVTVFEVPFKMTRSQAYSNSHQKALDWYLFFFFFKFNVSGTIRLKYLWMNWFNK